MRKMSYRMQECLNKIREHGVLIRYKGGLWSSENVEFEVSYNNSQTPVWWFGIETLEALERRGLVEVSETKESTGWGYKDPYAVEYKIVVSGRIDSFDEYFKLVMAQYAPDSQGSSWKNSYTQGLIYGFYLSGVTLDSAITYLTVNNDASVLEIHKPQER